MSFVIDEGYDSGLVLRLLTANRSIDTAPKVSFSLKTNTETPYYFFAAVADLTVLLLGNLSPAGLHKIISKGTNKKSSPEFTGVL